MCHARWRHGSLSKDTFKLELTKTKRQKKNAMSRCTSALVQSLRLCDDNNREMDAVECEVDVQGICWHKVCGSINSMKLMKRATNHWRRGREDEVTVTECR